MDALSPARPRTGRAVLLIAIIATVSLGKRVAREICGCYQPSRLDIAIAEASELSAFGAFERAFCTAPGDQLVPMALQRDPWGNPYMFVCNTRGITVVSAGEDGRFFTDDDIRSDR